MQRSIPVVATLGLALILSGCSSESNEGTPTSSAPATTAAAGDETLTIWVDETKIKNFEPIAAAFEEETGTKVELVQKAQGDIRKEFIQQVPTGQGPDVIIGAHDWTGELVTNGVVQPVEIADRAAEFNPNSIAAFTYDGAVYGVPYAVENIGLVRNNALASTTPATFDELLAQGKELGTKYPFLVQQGEGGDAFHLYPLQTSFGAPVFERDDTGAYTTTLGLGGEAGDNFAAFLKKLGDEKILDPAITGDIAKQAFLDGETPYMLTGPWYTADFVTAGLDISVLPVPSAGGSESEPFIGVQGAFISIKTENKILANKFVVDYLGSEEVQTTLYESGSRMPALNAAAEKVDDKILQEFNAASGTAIMPSIPEMGAVWEFWGAGQLEIITGKSTDPAATWQAMVTNIQSKIDG